MCWHRSLEETPLLTGRHFSCLIYKQNLKVGTIRYDSSPYFAILENVVIFHYHSCTENRANMKKWWNFNIFMLLCTNSDTQLETHIWRGRLHNNTIICIDKVFFSPYIQVKRKIFLSWLHRTTVSEIFRTVRPKSLSRDDPAKHSLDSKMFFWTDFVWNLY